MTNSITRRGAEQWKIPLEGGAVRADYAEKLLIGSSLVEFEKCREAIADLDRSAIVSDAHRTILEAMAQLANEQRPVDAATVFDRLTEIGKVPEIPEGVNYLLELMDQSEGYSPSHVAEWVEIINTKGEVRRFQQGLEDLAKLAASGAAIEGLRSNLLRLGEALPQVGYRRERLMSDAVREYVSQISTGKAETMQVGIPCLDDAIGGTAPGELIVIGGRPGQGKSLLALQWLEEATGHGIPGLIISEEMSALSLAKRTVQRIMPESGRNDHEQLTIEIQRHFEGRAPLLIAESCGSVDVAERAIAAAVRRYGIKICAVDYAQLLKGSGATQYERVSDVSTRMKRAATKHEIVILLLCQLSRSIESRPSAVPQLSDLRDSGQLEQDADVVLFAQWPAKVDPSYRDSTEYRIYQAKNRSRGIGHAIVQMRINPGRQRLDPWEPQLPNGF